MRYQLSFSIVFFAVIAFVVLPQVSFAQNASDLRTKIFQGKMRAIDAGNLFADNARIKIWGVRSLDNLPVLLAEHGRWALDNAIGSDTVSCELKQRYEDYLVAQCENSKEQDLGILMLQAGFVTADRGAVYGGIFEEPYLQAEAEAEAQKIGLWSANEGGQDNGLDPTWLIVLAVVLFVIILTAFGILSLVIVRGFEKVIEAQDRNIEIIGRERKIKNKERAVVARMLDSEIKANKSKIEAYLAVYEEMLSDMNNPQRQPKYKKAGDIVQRQPALDRSVFDRNTNNFDVLGDELSSVVVHFYAGVKTKPDYINLEPDMPLDEAIGLVEDGIKSAQRMNKLADRLIDSFDNGGLSSEYVTDSV